MSMELMVKAMKIKVGNPLRKLVLLKLADNASDLGECWPSHQHIADQCEISKRSVIEHIKALVDMKLLRVENRVKNNEKQSNVYYLTLDKKSSAGNSLPSATDAQGGAGDSLPSAGDSQGGSAGDAHRTSHSSEPVIEPVNESLSAKRKKNKFDVTEFLKDHSVSDLVIESFLSHRKNKKADNSPVAMNAFVREAQKANISVEKALEITIVKNWVGFNASWKWQDDPIVVGVNQAMQGKPVSKQQAVEDYNKSLLGKYGG